ncbi:MAG: hypothetical protein FIA97_12965 [Methylococcaceae bacterium]|nr:hypothetical protein [Methylococcaceae bacterium]
MLNELSADHFRGHIGETFLLLVPEGPPLDLVLTEVEINPRARMPNVFPGRRIPFSLVLKGDADQSLRTGVMPLQHPRLGTLPGLLINRVMAPDGVFDPHAWYQICFT